MEVSFSAIRGSLDVVPDPKQPLNQGPADSSGPCFLIFDGVGLTEDGLKDWLRLCARQVNTQQTKSALHHLLCGPSDVFPSACADKEAKEDEKHPFTTGSEAHARECALTGVQALTDLLLPAHTCFVCA